MAIGFIKEIGMGMRMDGGKLTPEKRRKMQREGQRGNEGKGTLSQETSNLFPKNCEARW